MNIQNRIRQLQSELAVLNGQQENCPHKWNEPFKDILEKSVPIQEDRAMGSDVYPVVVGWRKEEIPVWKRVCQTCGKVEITEKVELVVVGERPMFSQAR